MSELLTIVLIEENGTRRPMTWATPLPNSVAIPVVEDQRPVKYLSDDEPIPVHVNAWGDIEAFPMSFGQRTYRRRGDTLEYE